MDLNESRETVQAYTDELGLTFPTVLDSIGSVAETYGARGVPTSFFVNREGMIHVQHLGPLNESLIEEYLAPIL